MFNYCIKIKGKDQTRYSRLGAGGYLTTRKVHALGFATREDADRKLAAIMADPRNASEFDAYVDNF